MWTVLSTCWCALWDIMSESCCCFVSLKQNSYMRRKTHLYETRLTARQHWQQSWDWVEKWSRSSQTATPAPLLAFCTKPKCQNLHRDLDILNSRLSSLGFFQSNIVKWLIAYCMWNFLKNIIQNQMSRTWPVIVSLLKSPSNDVRHIFVWDKT